MRGSKDATKVRRPGYWQEKFQSVVAIFVSSMKEHFKEMEEASAELKQQAVTGVIGIEASKNCWEQICKNKLHGFQDEERIGSTLLKNKMRMNKLMQTLSGEMNEDKSFVWKGKVKTAEKYARLFLLEPKTDLSSSLFRLQGC